MAPRSYCIHHTFCGDYGSPATVSVHQAENWPVSYIELILNRAPAEMGSWAGIFHRLVVRPTQYGQERLEGTHWMMHYRGVVSSPPIQVENAEVSLSTISLHA
jgi:hypothetical protein